jgi:hypothetical protein
VAQPSIHRLHLPGRDGEEQHDRVLHRSASVSGSAFGQKYDTNQIFDAGGIEPRPIPSSDLVDDHDTHGGTQIGLPFRIWPIDHVGPTPEEERRMRHTLEIALDNERRKYTDFEKYEDEMSAFSTLIPAGSVEVVEEYIHSLYLLAKSARG